MKIRERKKKWLATLVVPLILTSALLPAGPAPSLATELQETPSCHTQIDIDIFSWLKDNFGITDENNQDSQLQDSVSKEAYSVLSIIQFNQDGKTNNDCEYDLYEVDDRSQEEVFIASSAKLESGKIVFVREDGSYVKTSDLSQPQYILREKSPAEGYRHSKDIVLHTEENPESNQALLVVDNTWVSGAYAMPRAQIISHLDSEEYLKNGSIYAVVLKGDSKAIRELNFVQCNTIYGNPFSGWKITGEKGQDGIIQAVNAIKATSDSKDQALEQNGVYAFKTDNAGNVYTDIKALPGDILKYSWNDQEDASFTVAYISAESLDALSKGEFEYLDPSQFESTLSNTIYTSTFQNRLLIQSINDTGLTSLTGAEFALYDKEDLLVSDNHVWLKKSKSVEPVMGPVKTEEFHTLIQTNDTDKMTLVPGAASFVGIPSGSYYLVQTKAPKGYTINPTAIEVVVDDNGVHVNAGDPDDYVSVSLGVGKIAKGINQFAMNDGLDATLHDISVNLETAPSYRYDEKINEDQSSWKRTDTSTSLSYEPESSVIEYSPTTGEGLINLRYDENWGRIEINQTDSENTDPTKTLPQGTPKQNLLNEKEQDGLENLNGLFSGSVTVAVGNVEKD